MSFGTTKDTELKLRKYQLLMMYLHYSKWMQIIQGQTSGCISISNMPKNFEACTSICHLTKETVIVIQIKTFTFFSGLNFSF